jgi:hypothetical protein
MRNGKPSSKNGVGYRRPPKTTQFKKGRSGNPRGRPKDKRNIGKVLLDVTEQKIAVTENGKTRRMPALEVMLRRLANDAIQNDQSALKLFVSLLDRYADLTETTVVPDISEVLAEDREILERYLKTSSETAQLYLKTQIKARNGEMQFDRRLYQALLRNDFRAFLEKSFKTLSPGNKFVWNWHIDAITWQLERARRGQNKRLIINMPPRSLKSLTASVAWPAFILGLDPSQRIICVSYSGELARKFSNDFRALINAPWYKVLFPWTRISRFKDSEVETEFTSRGFRLATSVGGTLTGRGGDIIIIDDPLKPDDIYSDAKRSAPNEWFSNTLLSRLDDKRTGAIVVVMQRVHLYDLTGFLLDQSDEWEVLGLPAIAYADQDIPTWGGPSS